MKKRIIELKERKRHFQWVAEWLSQSDKVLYLEKDWYDNPTLISKEDAKKEVEQAQKELELLLKVKSKSFWRSMRRLFHISEKESTMENKHIEQYIELRTGLSEDDWNTLNALYEFQMHEKERQLTKDISLDDSDIKVFRSNAQKLV